MRIVFFGTPSFAVPSLAALVDAGHDVVSVWTQPDRPAGRGNRLRAPAVKELALERGIPVRQPESIKPPEIADELRALDADLFVVAAYGKILPQRLLDVPRLGAVNVHASVLPRYRGAAPIHHAIRSGETTTGVTIMQMNARMDSGEILHVVETPIRDDDTMGSLTDRLAGIGARALMEVLPSIENGTATRVPQDDSAATLAPMIHADDARIDWSAPAVSIERAVRAFAPQPGAFTFRDGERLKIFAARPIPGDGEPGMVIETTKDSFVVAAGSDALEVLEVQPAGKRRMSARDYVAGFPPHVGEKLS